MFLLSLKSSQLSQSKLWQKRRRILSFTTWNVLLIICWLTLRSGISKSTFRKLSLKFSTSSVSELNQLPKKLLPWSQQFIAKSNRFHPNKLFPKNVLTTILILFTEMYQVFTKLEPLKKFKILVKIITKITPFLWLLSIFLKNYPTKDVRNARKKFKKMDVFNVVPM